MSKHPLSFLVRPAFVLAAVPLLTSCSSDGADGFCPADAKARIDELSVAAAEFDAIASDIELELLTACTEIAVAGGETVDSSADVTTACAAASRVLGSIKGEIQIQGTPPTCHVDLQAQVNCDAQCQVDASCTPGSIEVRCEPGEFSVKCEPVSCEGQVSCEGSASVAVNCEGSCSATCEGRCDAEISGTCEGTCNGTCDGTESSGACSGVCKGSCEGTVKAQCSGSCEGSCRGTCTADASASFSCESDFRCRGGCSEAEVRAPRCDGDVVPPKCDFDADCQANCDATASMEAECIPGKLIITGNIDAPLVDALETHLPVIQVIFEKTGLLVESGVTLANAYSSAVNAGLGCAFAAAGNIVSSAQATVSASVKIEASFNASATINASSQIDQ